MMDVLVVEDNGFNAFCLSRIFKILYPSVVVKVVESFDLAKQQLQLRRPTFVVLDGDLGENTSSNGPALADFIWNQCTDIPLVAWTDCCEMKAQFARVFARHGKTFNDNTNWNKAVNSEKITSSLAAMAIKLGSMPETWQNSSRQVRLFCG